MPAQRALRQRLRLLRKTKGKQKKKKSKTIAPRGLSPCDQLRGVNHIRNEQVLYEKDKVDALYKKS